MHLLSEPGHILEDIDVSGFIDTDDAIAGEFDLDEVGWFGSKLVKSVGKAAKSVGKVATGVVKSPILQVGVGVLAVAFPAVGIPAAAAVAAANLALRTASTGAAAAKDLNAKIGTLKSLAKGGDTKAQHSVNAYQVALGAQKAKALGMQRLRPVAVPGRGSFSTTPVPLAKLQAKRQPTSLYAPTPAPGDLALKLAAGGTPLGVKVIAAVKKGQSVAVPNAMAVIPGQRPTRHEKVWIGRAPKGTKARELKGAHVITRTGFVVAGQSVFVAA